MPVDFIIVTSHQVIDTRQYTCRIGNLKVLKPYIVKKKKSI